AEGRRAGDRVAAAAGVGGLDPRCDDLEEGVAKQGEGRFVGAGDEHVRRAALLAAPGGVGQRLGVVTCGLAGGEEVDVADLRAADRAAGGEQVVHVQVGDDAAAQRREV